MPFVLVLSMVVLILSLVMVSCSAYSEDAGLSFSLPSFLFNAKILRVRSSALARSKRGKGVGGVGAVEGKKARSSLMGFIIVIPHAVIGQ